MIKGSIPEEDITIINIYAPNIGAPQYVRQMLTRMKGEINNNTIIVGDFNTPLTPMDRSTKQKINKETQTVNDTMVQLDLIDIYRTFHPKTINFTFFSSAYTTQNNLYIQCNPYQATNSIYHRTRTNNFTICMEIQKNSNSQSNLEKEEWNWRNQPA